MTNNNLTETVKWLCSLSSSTVHQQNVKNFVKKHSAPEFIGSSELIESVDINHGIVCKKVREAPNHDLEEVTISFDDLVYSKAAYIIENYFTEIVEPLSGSDLKNELEEFDKTLTIAINSTNDVDYFDSFPKYKQSLHFLQNEFKRILKANKTPIKGKSKAGRKKSKEAPQHKIEETIEKLLNSRQSNKFFKKNGQIKPTTLRDHLFNNHPEVTGTLTDRALFDRVKEALEKMKK